MDCAGDVSSLRSSVGCDCRAQFWTSSLCYSCCKCKMLVARVLKLPSLSVAPFCRATALPSWPLLSSPLCAPCGVSCCGQLRLLTSNHICLLKQKKVFALKRSLIPKGFKNSSNMADSKLFAPPT